MYALSPSFQGGERGRRKPPQQLHSLDFMLLGVGGLRGFFLLSFIIPKKKSVKIIWLHITVVSK